MIRSTPVPNTSPEQLRIQCDCGAAIVLEKRDFAFEKTVRLFAGKHGECGAKERGAA